MILPRISGYWARMREQQQYSTLGIAPGYEKTVAIEEGSWGIREVEVVEMENIG